MATAGSISLIFSNASIPFLYLIKGQIELTVGEETRIIQAGDFVTIPQGSVHAMQRVGASEALFFDIASPPDVGDVIWHE